LLLAIAASALLAVSASPSDPTLEKADRWPFGVNHGHNFSIMVEGGLLWHRQDFTWNAIEPKNGTFIFDQYDQVVEEATQAGVRILGILDYSAEWASSAPTIWTDGRDRAPPKNLEDWKEYVYKTVEHFKGRVSHWEVWNEPNIDDFWLPEPDPLGYANLLRAAYLAAKEADPECTVLIGGAIGFNFNFLRQVYSYGASRYFDAMAWHPYPGNDSCFDQFDFSGSMKELKDMMAANGDADKEIWFTELAWGIGPNVTRDDQANLLVRAYVLSLAEGVDRLLWFNFRGSPLEEGSGLIDSDFTRRPAFIAHANLARVLEGAQYDAKLNMKSVQCHSFRKKEERIVFIWVPSGTREIRRRLKSKVEDVGAQDIVGGKIDLGGSKRIKLLLSERPIIITGLTAADVRSMTVAPYTVLFVGAPLAAALATGLGGIYFGVLRRRKIEAPVRAPKPLDVSLKCQGVFDPDLCYRCRSYAVKGSKHFCMKSNKFLEH